jgi:site-specific DNA recombinase
LGVVGRDGRQCWKRPDRLASIKLKLDAVDRSHGEIAELAAKALDFSQALRQLWPTADYAAKRKILEIVLSNSWLDGETLCPTIRTREPFDVLAEGLVSKESGGGGNRTRLGYWRNRRRALRLRELPTVPRCKCAAF